jgi:hypothetical protein
LNKNGIWDANFLDVKKQYKMVCVAIRADGHPCNKAAREGAFRCGTHIAARIRNGPNATEVAEAKAIFKKDLKELTERHGQDVARVREGFRGNQEAMGRELDLLYEIFVNAKRIMRFDKLQAVRAILAAQADAIQRNGGVNPDAEADARRVAARARRWANFERAARIREDARQAGRAVRIAPVNPAPAPVGNLAAFANDNQNVHTTHAVNQTKEIVGRILKIPVPPEYRWNMSECSKTPGEIILECKVSPTATWQMMAKYCQADNVYELREGIYGRVLDCVWQYIKGSEHKEDLCKILKTEMEDNIGMCAQGNLSRLANILSGYMEGVGPQESVAQILGRLLPPLMEIEDEEERLSKAIKIMDEYAVLENDRDSWLEALA